MYQRFQTDRLLECIHRMNKKIITSTKKQRIFMGFLKAIEEEKNKQTKWMNEDLSKKNGWF